MDAVVSDEDLVALILSHGIGPASFTAVSLVCKSWLRVCRSDERVLRGVALYQGGLTKGAFMKPPRLYRNSLVRNLCNSILKRCTQYQRLAGLTRSPHTPTSRRPHQPSVCHYTGRATESSYDIHPESKIGKQTPKHIFFCKRLAESIDRSNERSEACDCGTHLTMCACAHVIDFVR